MSPLANADHQFCPMDFKRSKYCPQILFNLVHSMRLLPDYLQDMSDSLPPPPSSFTTLPLSLQYMMPSQSPHSFYPLPLSIITSSSLTSLLMVNLSPRGIFDIIALTNKTIGLICSLLQNSLTTMLQMLQPVYLLSSPTRVIACLLTLIPSMMLLCSMLVSSLPILSNSTLSNHIR